MNEQPPSTGLLHKATVLLTGFGSFPDVPVNASWPLVQDIAKTTSRAILELDLHIIELPTNWRAAPTILQKALARYHPDIILHFGVSAAATGFEIETTARNITCQMKDADGHIPVLDCLQVGGPDHLPVRLDGNAIVTALVRDGLPARISDDAGAYLCNAILYHSLLYTQDHRHDMLAGFIHIPDTLAAQIPGRAAVAPSKDEIRTHRPAAPCNLNWDEAVRGGVTILRCAVDHYAKQNISVG